MRDITQFKERFQRWKKTGELPYEAGRIKNADSDREELVYEDSLSLSALPAYEGGKDGTILNHDYANDVFTGARLFDGQDIVVTGHRRPKPFKWVSPKGVGNMTVMPGDPEMVFFAPIAAGAGIAASPALSGLISNVATPGSAFWTSPITKQLMVGTVAAEGVNKATKAVTGYNSVGEGVGASVEKATGWNPNSTLVGQLATESFNPGWYLSPNGLLNTARKVGSAVKKFPRAIDNVVRNISPYYDLYRTISETTPGVIPKNQYIDIGDLLGKNGERYFWEGTKLTDFARSLRGGDNNAYYIRTPKDVDILKLKNGRFRHEVVGNEVLSSGEVNGKFVSYGEPWKEFGFGENSALYEFPVGPKRGPSLIATDWKGRPMKYSVDEIYDFMKKERAGIWDAFERDVKNQGIDKLPVIERILAVRKLKEEKYPELLNNFDTTVYGANQTVIPNEKWNFEKFLKTPFWKYSDDPVSGQLQKELFVPNNKTAIQDDVPTISWGDAISQSPQAALDFSDPSGRNRIEEMMYSPVLTKSKALLIQELTPVFSSGDVATDPYVDVYNKSIRNAAARYLDLIEDKPTPQEVIDIFNNSVLPRLLFMRPGYRGGLMYPTVKSKVDHTLSRGYTVYPKELFEKARGNDITVGLHYPETGHIGIKEGYEDFAGGHEFRHRLDKFLMKTDDESDILEAAYDDDFLKLSSLYDDLKDVRMGPEAVTTNFDARNAAIGKYHAANTDWKLLNKMIDKLSDEKIIEAVEKSNGYGSAYIDYLRKNNKLTSTKIHQFREAMKLVGMFAGAAPLLNPSKQK